MPRARDAKVRCPPPEIAAGPPNGSYGHCIGASDIFFAMSKGEVMSTEKPEVLQGTLDLIILKTLHALGPQHGFGIARRIEQISQQVLKLNEGTVYTALL